jgi:hypothetical protein
MMDSPNSELSIFDRELCPGNLYRLAYSVRTRLHDVDVGEGKYALAYMIDGHLRAKFRDHDGR